MKKSVSILSKRITRVNHMIDRNGYRSNVGIILLNKKNEVFWGKRIKQNSAGKNFEDKRNAEGFERQIKEPNFAF